MGSALPNLGLPSKADIYGAALEGLVQVNDRIMDRVALPPVYESGARWRNIAHTNWRHAHQIATEGWGDCEGISAWRTAELRRTGEDPDARVGCYHTGHKKYHAIVIRGNDYIEDPSVVLGMRSRPSMPRTREDMNTINGMWPARGRESAWCVVGDADGDEQLTTTLVDKPNGETAARIKIPLADGTALIAQTTPAMDKAVTAARGAAILADMASGIAKNPIMLAQLNPYTAAAITLYTNPDVQRSLKSLGGSVKSLGGAVRSLFHF